MDILDFKMQYENHIPTLAGIRGSYAVLVPLFRKHGALQLLFEVRASTLKSQPGEVCFPGGKMEADESVIDCAIRETAEELNITADDIHIIGRLDFLHHQSGTVIYPVLGEISEAGIAHMLPSTDEVSETFSVPFSWFLENPPLIYRYALKPEVPADFPYDLIGFDKPYAWKNGHAEVPIYRYGDYPIWGLTGRMVLGLTEQMKNG